MYEIRHFSQDYVQNKCTELGVTIQIFVDTLSGNNICSDLVRLVGLCPHCNQPIGFILTNEDKSLNAKILKLYHLFSNSAQCEDNTTNEQISNLTGTQKFEFFANRHNEKLLIQACYLKE